MRVARTDRDRQTDRYTLRKTGQRGKTQRGVQASVGSKWGGRVPVSDGDHVQVCVSKSRLNHAVVAGQGSQRECHRVRGGRAVWRQGHRELATVDRNIGCRRDVVVKS